MKQRLPFLLAISLLTGCAGVAVGTYGKEEWVRERFALANERNKYAFDSHPTPYSREEIIARWGEPDRVASADNCEVLIFDNGTSWAGMGAFVAIMPVPLAVPSGTYKNRFYLRNNQALGLIQEYGAVGRMVGYTCGSNECGASTGEQLTPYKEKADDAIARWCADAG